MLLLLLVLGSNRQPEVTSVDDFRDGTVEGGKRSNRLRHHSHDSEYMK